MNPEIAAALAEVYTMLPGVIVSYDGVTATVRPALSKQLANGETLAAPSIVRVPVKWPVADGGRARVTLPLKPGDPVELTFSCRSLENWLSGSDGPPDDPRQFDLTDCFCTPVMRPNLGASDTENLSVSYGAGWMKIAPDGSITFASPLVTVNAPMTVNGLITYTAGMVAGGGAGNTLKITGNMDITGGSVKHNGKEIGSTHKHPGDSGGTTGEPL